MRAFLLSLAALVALASPTLAANAPAYLDNGGRGASATGVVCVDPALPAGSNLFACASGSGGGGGGSAPSATVGGTYPSTASPTAGRSGADNLTRPLRTDAAGGLYGAGATGTSTRTTLTASASTALPGGAATTRPSYLRLTVETALAANLFLCLANQTCSATVYDEMIPSGAAVGTRLFTELPFTAAVTYFTTGTPTVNAARLGD